MPEWATLVLVAVADWMVVSVFLRMLIGGLLRRLANEPQIVVVAGRRWRRKRQPAVRLKGRHAM
jgi:hypothetical protein